MTAIRARWSVPLLALLVTVAVAVFAAPEGSKAGPATGPFAYVAGFNSGTVIVIDIPTETQVTSFVTGGDPYWVAISANDATVAATLHDSTGVALIDGTTNTLIAVVAGVGDEPEAVAVNSTGTTVYVADEDDDDLYVVDVATKAVTAGPIALTCDEPENMVISPDDAFLYITCAGFSGSTVIRVATAGFAELTIATGLSDPHGIALNPAGTRLYYTDGTDVFEWNTSTLSLTGQ